MSHRVACLAYLAGCLLFVPAAPLMGATFRSSEILVIEADEVIDDDLYLVGKEIHVKGTVKGDDIAFAIVRNFQGQDVKLLYKGTVSGAEIKFTQTRDGGNMPPREFTARRVTS